MNGYYSRPWHGRCIFPNRHVSDNDFGGRLGKTLMDHYMESQDHMETNTNSPKFIWVNILENPDENKGEMVLTRAVILPCEDLDPIFVYKINCGYLGTTFVDRNGNVYNTLDTKDVFDPEYIVKYKLVGKVY